MKAIVYRKYGSPDVLSLENVDRPVPKNDEVLVRVHASSINDYDWGLLTGKPFVNRVVFGLRKPRHRILGCDIAGRVETVGENVKGFQTDDEVFGDVSGCGFGGFAEYVCARENALTLKPASMTFEQAAAIPQAAVLALQGIRDWTQLQPGHKVLVNGAGGGAGSFMVQIAKSLGAEVTGVDSARKLDLMRSIGADHVIDYAKEDFTKNGQRYDLILDNKAYHSIFDYRRSLRSAGTYAMLGGSSARIFQVMILGPLVSMIGSKKLGVVILKQNKHLDYFKELFEDGKVVPVIDRTYPLSDVPEALQYFGKAHALGKIVITI